MNLQSTLRALCSARPADEPVVTWSLEVARARLSPAAKAFLRDALERRVHPGGVPSGTREALRSFSEKIARYVETELHSETQGLYLVIGDQLWQPVQLPVPVTNFVHVGRRPYVAPLLEAATRTPRAYVLKYDQHEGVLQDFELGTWTELDRIPSPAVKRDAEHTTPGRAGLGRTSSQRAGGGTGGGGRDRFERHFEDAIETMLHRAAAKVVSLQKRTPSEAIYAFGDREHFPFFRDQLPAGLRTQALHVGPVPHRHEDLLRKAVQRELGLLTQERVDRAVAEFRDRRAEGCRVALGAGQVLPLLDTGRVDRLFIDAYDPLMGGICPECGALYEGFRERCDPCGKELATASMTQQVVAHAVLHPPLPLTFVGASQAWLKDLGGMAALLSKKGVRTKR